MCTTREPGKSGKSEQTGSKRPACEPMRMLWHRAALAVVAGLVAWAPAVLAAEAFAGYAWGYSDNEDGPSLVLGSTETTEDFVFLLSCSNVDKTAEMTVYVDIEGAKVDQSVTIDLMRDGAKASVKGKTPILDEQTICTEIQGYVNMLVDYTKTACSPGAFQIFPTMSGRLAKDSFASPPPYCGELNSFRRNLDRRRCRGAFASRCRPPAPEPCAS